MAKKKSAEIKAGIVVVVGLLILGGAMFLVSGGKEQFEPKAYYTILFLNSGGISGGDTVYLDGQRVGYVYDTAREKRETDDGKVLRYIAVTIEISKDAEVPVDCSFIVTQTITKIVSMEITSGKSPDLSDDKTELFGERLKTFEQTIHEAGELMGDAREVVRNVNEVVLKVDKIVAEVDIKTLQKNANDFLLSLGRAGKEIEEIIKESRQPIKETLASAKEGVADFAGLAKKVRAAWPPMEEKVTTILDNVGEASGDVKGIVKENRESIKSFITKLDDAADRVGPALEKIEAVGQSLNETVVEVRPQLTGAMKSARKAMENFEALTGDLKSAPWKLVNKPSGEEASAVLMFEAAQRYVDGAGEVSKTIKDLDTLRRLGVLEDPDQKELVQKLLARMQQALKDFDANEKKLVDMLVNGEAVAGKK